MSPIGFRPAIAADVEAVLELMASFYEEFDIEFHPILARSALEELIRSEALGRLWLIEEGNGPAGYIVVSFGFSFEYHGRDAFVDELYVRPDARKKGAGSRALAFVEAVCSEMGVNALHLESQNSRPAIQDFFRRHGFADHGRCLLTKWLGAPRPGGRERP